MMELSYIETNPTENITVIIKTPVDMNAQSEIAEKIMAEKAECEQVGFADYSDSGTTSLRMMGGEFCGNASMSLAAIIAEERNLNELTIELNVSGTEKPVGVSVKRTEEGYEGAVAMPLPLEIKEYSFNRYTVPVVIFSGIAHAIVEQKMPVALAKMLIRDWNKEIGADALGIMLLNQEKGMLTPVVHVRSTDTVVCESSCASGTAAVGAYLAMKNGCESSIILKEPGGTLKASAKVENGRVNAITLVGNVSIVEQGKMLIND